MKLPLDGIDIKIKITLKDRLARYWTVNVDIALFDNTFLEIGLTYDVCLKTAKMFVFWFMYI